MQQRARAPAEVGRPGTGRSRPNVRKMLLAFSRDLRVVLLRLASRLQTLRYYAATAMCPHPALARESQQVFAPLANRLGIWQIKWEMEDLAFRFLEPDTYRRIAACWTRSASSASRRGAAPRRAGGRAARAGHRARCRAGPSTSTASWKKMRGKGLDFDQVFDVRALRVVVPTVKDCYAALALGARASRPVPEEFDDYIARPKPNGYQSLHTVVRDAAGAPGDPDPHPGHARARRARRGRALGLQGGRRQGLCRRVSASGDYDAKIAVLRQLLAWERDLSGGGAAAGPVRRPHLRASRPRPRSVELPPGATPVDFAYTLHTDLGHRCRGARVDGAMVPLNTPLQNGQTVEITAAKEGGPSRDWLNPSWATWRSPRAKAKVRAWFNAQAQRDHRARPRAGGKAAAARRPHRAVKLDTWRAQLGFKGADALFEVVGKDELSLRTSRPAAPGPSRPTGGRRSQLLRAARQPRRPAGGVLVVGVDSLLTQLARCCKPAPPDAIGGFVTRGKGVACTGATAATFRHMAARARARDRGRMGQARDRPGAVPGGRGGGGGRPPGPAARHLRGVRQGEDERHRRADAVRQGHRLDDLHRGGRPTPQPPGAGAGQVQEVGVGVRGAPWGVGAEVLRRNSFSSTPALRIDFQARSSAG
jgi:GTP pyrophosphokinase